MLGQLSGQSWEVALTRAKPFEARVCLPSWAAPFAAPGHLRPALAHDLPVRNPAGTDVIELPVTARARLTVVAVQGAMDTQARDPDHHSADLRSAANT